MSGTIWERLSTVMPTVPCYFGEVIEGTVAVPYVVVVMGGDDREYEDAEGGWTDRGTTRVLFYHDGLPAADALLDGIHAALKNKAALVLTGGALIEFKRTRAVLELAQGRWADVERVIRGELTYESWVSGAD